jgi:peptide/nickel transport system permease protein
VILGSLLLVALFADLLASDLPLLMSYKGKLYVLPNLLRPVELRGEDNQSLRKEFEEQDWAVWPLVPYGPDQTQPGGELDMSAPPGALHPLGTDPVGRDVAARLIHGVRPALAVGVSAVVLSVALGFFLGGLAGYFAGPADWLVSWAVAVTLTFPAFLLVLSLQGLAALRTWWGLAFILGLVGWAPVARLVRGQTRRASASEFVLAARASGASHLRILVRHVLPNATGPVIVMAAFGVGWAILMESALSFLGVGPSTASWGQLLASARLDPQAWWLTLTGGSAIFLTVLATNLLAEASRRALSPRGSETWRT